MTKAELVRLNRDDIAFDERECVVFGKGDKERMVYFDARTKIHLQNYLDSRTDGNEALFVSLKAPHNRMKIGGIKLRLRELGKRLKWYTNENIDQMLMERHLNKKARRSSHKNHIRGPRKRTNEDDERFAQSFEKLVLMAQSKEGK